jgi:hypothetical protein
MTNASIQNQKPTGIPRGGLGALLAGVGKVALGATAFLFGVGCRPSGNPPTSAKAPHITARPNPVPSGAGITTVEWDTGSGEPGGVYVVVDGGEEKLFAEHSSGSVPADWIQAGMRYEFRLYAMPDKARLLGSVKVARSNP